MKDRKSSLALLMAVVGMAVLLFQSQQGISHATLPNLRDVFQAHYRDVNVTIDPAVTAEDGTFVPGIRSVRLPVLDRTVRISLTLKASDGEIGFGEIVACYKSSTGECGFQVADSSVFTGAGIPLIKFDASYLAMYVEGGNDGTITLQNHHTAGGTVHVAMWY